MMKLDNSEALGRLADDLDAALYASKLPLPPRIHMDALVSVIRNARDVCAKTVVDETGENPWEGNPLSG